MSDNVNAEIIAIGTEILLGEITDTNSVHIARCLRDLGINLYYMTSVGDNENRIASAIRIALDRADLVITCGGLGPTIDDMTRQGIALACDRPLVFDQTLYDQIAARFQSFRVQMTENNRRQAFLPEGAIAIENPVGTAPSFIVEEGHKSVISLPGVPREMIFLMAEKVTPYLSQKYNLGIIKAKLLHTAGIGESALDEIIGSDILALSNPTVGLAAHHGIIDIRITAKADTLAAADVMISEMEAEIRQRVGAYIYGVDGARIEPTLIDFLNARKLHISVVEAGIEEAAISKLSQHKAADNGLDGVAQYADMIQLYQAFDLDDAVSMRDAASMVAESMFRKHGSAASIAILSHSAARESADSDYNTVVAVHTADKQVSRVYGFGSESEMAKVWVSRWAMAQVWRMLVERAANVD